MLTQGSRPQLKATLARAGDQTTRNRIVAVIVALVAGALATRCAEEPVSLADVVGAIEADRPNIVCTEHELVDQYGPPNARAFVVKSKCDYRPGAEPFVATNHFVVIMRGLRSGHNRTTVALHHGESLPPRIDVGASDLPEYPAFSRKSEGWGIVIAFFVVPIGFAAIVYVVAVVTLRVRRSHRLHEIVPRRFVLNWRKPRPWQRRSHWTVIEEDDSDEPG